MALVLTQPVIEMRTSNISWEVKVDDLWGYLHIRIVLKSGSLTLLESPGPVQALFSPLFKTYLDAMLE